MADQGTRIAKMVSEICIPPAVHQALRTAAAAFEEKGMCTRLQQIHSQSGVLFM